MVVKVDPEIGTPGGIAIDAAAKNGASSFVIEPLDPNPDLHFPLSIPVYDEMRSTDGQVASLLSAINLPILAARWQLQGANVRPEIMTFVRSELGLDLPGEALERQRKHGIVWLDHLEQSLLALPFGFMCVDEETEALTRRGWKRHDEMLDDDEFLTLNPDTGLSEWQRVERINRWIGTHKVRRLEGRSHSSVTTADHNWIVRDYDSKKLRFKKTDKLNSNDVVIMGAESATLPTRPTHNDSFVELVAWFYTEGHIRPSESVGIYQSHGVNDPHVRSIRAALTDVFGEPSAINMPSTASTVPAWRENRRDDRDSTEFYLNQAAGRVLLAVAPGRVVDPSFIASLTASQLRLFIDTTVSADGWTSKTGQQVVVQKEGEQLDALEMAAALLGIPTTRSVERNGKGQKWFKTRLKKQTETRPVAAARRADGRATDEWDTLEGLVWCPTVPNRTWYARRRGTTWFTGNCFEQVYEPGPPTAEQAALGTDLLLHLRKLAPRLPRTVSQIHVGRDGGLAGISQPPLDPKARDDIFIPVDRLVFYCHKREGADWSGRSILRTIYKNWMIGDKILRLSGQIIERNGMGIPVLSYDPAQVPKEQAERIVQDLRAGATAGAALPPGTKLELLGVTGQTVDPLPHMKYHDEKIAESALAMFKTLGHDSGARSLGDTFVDIFTQAVQSVADFFGRVATEHVIRDLVELNFGPDEPYPVLTPGDLSANKAITTTALKELVDAGVITVDDPLEAFMRSASGLPVADPKTARAAAPAPAPGAPAAPAAVGLAEGDHPKLSRLEAIMAELAEYRRGDHV